MNKCGPTNLLPRASSEFCLHVTEHMHVYTKSKLINNFQIKVCFKKTNDIKLTQNNENIIEN